MGYNTLERSMARVLESSPALKRKIKASYQFINNLVFRERGFNCELHPLTKLESANTLLKNSSLGESYFFGYYDKSPFSQDGRYLLIQKLSSTSKSVISVIVDKEKGVELEVNKSAAWNYQQGSMLQWFLDGSLKYINNIYQNGVLGAEIAEIASSSKIFVPYPVQAVIPGRPAYLSINYRRLYKLRAEYGYSLEASNLNAEMPFENDGVWLVDHANNTTVLTLSIQDAIDLKQNASMENAWHKLNHILVSPDGKKFIILHRWKSDGKKHSRLLLHNIEEKLTTILLDNEMISHCCWNGADQIIAWARDISGIDRYIFVDANSGQQKTVSDTLSAFGDGHPSVSPDGKWLLTDTYPNRSRQISLMLLNLETKEHYVIGRFYSPLKFTEGRRCDLHPRWAPDGKSISIDSTHEGFRRNYILSVDQFIKEHA